MNESEIKTRLFAKEVKNCISINRGSCIYLNGMGFEGYHGISFQKTQTNDYEILIELELEGKIFKNPKLDVHELMVGRQVNAILLKDEEEEHCYLNGIEFTDGVILRLYDESKINSVPFVFTDGKSRKKYSTFSGDGSFKIKK